MVNILQMIDSDSSKVWSYEIDFTKSVYWLRASKNSNIGGFVGIASGELVEGN
jgi:hypothetical protein